MMASRGIIAQVVGIYHSRYGVCLHIHLTYTLYIHTLHTHYTTSSGVYAYLPSYPGM